MTSSEQILPSTALYIDSATSPLGVFVTVFLTTFMIALYLYFFWNMIRQTGYSGWTFILLFIPVVNIIYIFILGFTEWPVTKENKKLKKEIELLKKQNSHEK